MDLVDKIIIFMFASSINRNNSNGSYFLQKARCYKTSQPNAHHAHDVRGLLLLPLMASPYK